jgi:cell wall assembly regulator SMI1
MDSNTFWAYVESRLDQRIPGRSSLLPAGADEETLKHAETILKITLPSTVSAFYQRHNGSGQICVSPWIDGGGPLYFVSLDNMIATWQGMCQISADFEQNEEDFGIQEGPIKRHYWSQLWIPITENQCGDNVFLDLDPDEGGNVGQIVDWWHEKGQSKLIAPSFSDWLKIIADALAKGDMHTE